MPGSTWRAGGFVKPSPLQIVKDQFGSREKLVEALVPMVDAHHGDSGKAEIRSRLMGLSNQKLLRLYRVEQAVRERFGDRDKLVQHLLDARKEAGLTADEDLKAKLDTRSKAQLLDMTRANLPERSAKLTPEQRLARKRGKKARERAEAAIRAKG
jgi:hypothetical protein